MNDITQLVPFSVGLVIADSINNNPYIRVIPIEQQGFIDGKIEDGYNEDVVEGTDSLGNSWQGNYTTSTGLSAKWISKDSNRRTPPSIHKGEKVQLYKYADSDDIFWEDMGQDTNNRTTERVVMAWSNKPKRDGKELDSTNSYFLEVDTNTGLVTLQTNKSNGEPFGFTLQIQTKKGIAVLENDVGDTVYIDGSKKDVGLENQSGCKVQLLDKDVNIKAVENVNIEAGKNINLKSGNSITGETKTINWNASTTYSVKTSTWNIQASSMTGKSSGTFAINSAGFTHNGVNVSSDHTHMEQGDGKPTGPPK